MANLLVVSDDGLTTVYVDSVEVDGEPYTLARCQCGEEITDRGHFEDTVQAAVIHVDMRH